MSRKIIIPEHYDYEEYCEKCDGFYVMFWSNCKCYSDNSKIDTDKALEEVEKIMKDKKNCESKNNT